MSRVKRLLSTEERYELMLLFHDYPSRRLIELIQEEDSVIEDWHLEYVSYLEGELYSALLKSIDEYSKGSEFSLKRRPVYFERLANRITKEHIKDVTLRMNAAFSRVEGRASRRPLKADVKLYEQLNGIKEGQSLLDQALDKLDK